MKDNFSTSFKRTPSPAQPSPAQEVTRLSELSPPLSHSGKSSPKDRKAHKPSTRNSLQKRIGSQIDARTSGFETPLLSTHLVGDIDGEADNKSSSAPTRTYVRDARAMASTPAADVSTGAKIVNSPRKSPRKRLSDQLSQKTKWNPRDPAQMQAVKEALHVATSQTNIVCREEEQRKVLDFCKGCIEKEKAGSLYVCGCPGTGKTMSIERVKELLLVWSEERGYQLLDMIAINCTSLANTSDIFSKILENFRPHKKMNGSFSPLQHLQTLFSQKGQLTSRRMILLVIDEMDYLITRDRSVLHDLFMLTNFPFSRCILVGIANAIDLADRFLPKLESLNCKPSIITFRAYSADQILKILQQRLMVLGYDVFQPSALEFCARKVAAASGDMRRALGVCRSAVELLEAELRDTKKEFDIVGFNHMELALSKAFKSAVVDTIQSLPQHQQIILCSLVKLFRQSKKYGTTVGELNKSYIGICKSTQVPAVGMLEFTSLCGVLSDQGLLKLGNSREDRLKRVTLQIDSSDVIFAFKGYRFFQSCLEG